ncbi:hypothetical protein SAMN02745213_01512 [Succinivibrio dextrinosolvens DSM 3072]|uniref:Uncharacterized protein n=1 Tax=Succinivibrio dextrinosolvens DSM 3072 TaxID=1123324 RepID=A0A1T4VH65_9GAMM|nr:hypothetical protein [Succinivibrio dextrinosolvens]SKA64279.1 hypothetical protein SAMN02745213_01512 [Succinivibrio dextrinosolvens DSM 3072]
MRQFYNYDLNSVSEEDDGFFISSKVKINPESILARLDSIIRHYGEATEENEFEFSSDVSELVSQIEIYDQAIINKYKASEPRELSSYLGKNDHSKDAIGLVEEFVDVLQDIPDGCAELFPFDMIDELTEEFL